MSTKLTIGFLPLVDACLPILAQEHGFAEEEGLALSFQKDVSWATVQDRLIHGHSDAAHLLAPLAIATTLGLGRPAQPLVAPFALGLNGNAITLRTELAGKVASSGKMSDPKQLGAALAIEANARKAQGSPLKFGVVHRYSSHNYMLRYWLSECGLRPDLDVEIHTVAPPFMADALASGEIDGACVGEPYSSVAVDKNVGVIVLASAQIWQRGVEKVLAMRESVLEEKRESIEALIRAMRRAGKHFIDPDNWEQNAKILARSDYLDGDPNQILRAISDRLVLSQGQDPVTYSDFMFQYREGANFPWVSQAQWLYSQMLRWDRIEYNEQAALAAQKVFRPDVYRSALRGTGDDLPGANSKVEGGVSGPLAIGMEQGSITLQGDAFFDGSSFDPDNLEAYLKRFL